MAVAQMVFVQLNVFMQPVGRKQNILGVVWAVCRDYHQCSGAIRICRVPEQYAAKQTESA